MDLIWRLMKRENFHHINVCFFILNNFPLLLFFKMRTWRTCNILLSALYGTALTDPNRSDSYNFQRNASKRDCIASFFILFHPTFFTFSFSPLFLCSNITWRVKRSSLPLTFFFAYFPNTTCSVRVIPLKVNSLFKGSLPR